MLNHKLLTDLENLPNMNLLLQGQHGPPGWKHSVCGCGSNCGNCCCGIFCPPCLACTSANRYVYTSYYLTKYC